MSGPEFPAQAAKHIQEDNTRQQLSLRCHHTRLEDTGRLKTAINMSFSAQALWSSGLGLPELHRTWHVHSELLDAKFEKQDVHSTLQQSLTNY
mmetsp:Transcript_151531/g.385246  ORF Transcript_151531/g.385246 Transcript_151531/m.385246 type:complete len:93 (+) Transcript_151531:251-529(+)